MDETVFHGLSTSSLSLYLSMARETPAMSSQYNNGVGSYIQEHPLDLTVKKNADHLNAEKIESGKSGEPFLTNPSFPSWYSTYLSIANRQYQYYPNNKYHTRQLFEQNADNITKNGKRKQETNTSEVFDKKIKLDPSNKKDTNLLSSEKVKSSGVWLPAQQPSLPERKTLKKSKAVLRSAIASITRQCDCRGCYQNHISKMRAGAGLGCVQ